MGVFDKFLNVLKLNNDEEYIDEEYYDDDDDFPEIPKKQIPQKVEEFPQDEHPKKTVTKFTPSRQAKKVSDNGMEVCVIKPNSMEDTREITETLLTNRTVVLNLEGLDLDLAQRIIDYASGSCYAINGKLQKISHYIFIITPASVDISGDFQELFSGSFDVPMNKL